MCRQLAQQPWGTTGGEGLALIRVCLGGALVLSGPPPAPSPQYVSVGLWGAKHPSSCHHGSSSKSHNQVPPESDKSAEKMLGAGGSEPKGGPPLRVSSQSKESVGLPGERDGEFAGDGSEDGNTERPSESEEGDSTSKEPGKSNGMGGSGSAGTEGRKEARVWGARVESQPLPLTSRGPRCPRTVRPLLVVQDVIDAPVRKQLWVGRWGVSLELLSNTGNPCTPAARLHLHVLTSALRIAACSSSSRVRAAEAGAEGAARAGAGAGAGAGTLTGTWAARGGGDPRDRALGFTWEREGGRSGHAHRAQTPPTPPVAPPQDLSPPSILSLAPLLFKARLLWL